MEAEKYKMQGYARITQLIMEENRPFFGAVGSKDIHKYIEPVLAKNDYIDYIKITDETLPNYIIEQLAKFYTVK